MIGELLPDFGERLAVDSKAIRSRARKSSDKMRRDGQPDRRGEHDASIAKKTKFVESADGTVEEDLYVWFGFKLHLAVDPDHQLPTAFEITKGLEGDSPYLEPLLNDWREYHEPLSERTKEVSTDKGYDAVENIQAARHLEAELLCPTRKMWRTSDGTVLDENGNEVKLKLLPDRKDGNLAYDQDGQIYCAYQPSPRESWTWRPMVYKGYEADRQALKYTCPAKAYGTECPSAGDCPKAEKTLVRVKLSEDPRIFVKTPRHTLKFKRLYSKRTAVERVNGVLDTVFGFEVHSIRGLAMMRLRVSLALIAMLAMAAGRLRAGQRQLYRSIVRME